MLNCAVSAMGFLIFSTSVFIFDPSTGDPERERSHILQKKKKAVLSLGLPELGKLCKVQMLTHH